MSSKRRRQRNRSGAGPPGTSTMAAPPGAGPRHRGTSRIVIIGLGAVAALAVSLLVVRGWPAWVGPGDGMPRPPEPPAMHAADALSPPLAYAEALRLVEEQRNFDSLPYFRRALTGRRQRMWEIHYSYAGALVNATLESRSRLGRMVPAIPYSPERLARVAEALEQLQRAEELADGPVDRALVHEARARVYWLWGLPWDAFTQIRTAQHLDPRTGRYAEKADDLQDLLENPVRSDP